MKKVFKLFAALMMVLSMNAATKTIYCKMAQSWWKADGAAVGAHYWGTAGDGTAWPGTRMTPVTGETDLWSVDIDTDKYQNIIFIRVNGSGTVSDWGAKTADLILPTDDKNLYTITSTSPVWGNPGVAGNWSVYAPDAPKTYKDITITVVANATPKIHYWEGGDKMVGSEWDAKPEMVATGEENTYSYTIKDVDEATGVKYLVVVGDVQSADQLAFENVNKNFKELLPQVSVMGVTGWDGDKMTVADDYLSASVTLTLGAAKDYELKLTVNGEWFGSNAITITKDNNSASFAENGDGNGKLTTDLAGDYVFTYTYATKTLVVTYPVPTPTYTVTVTAENGSVAGLENEGVYEDGASVTLTATADDGYEFVNWTVGGEEVSTENPYTFVVSADLALVANFQEVVVEPEYEVIEAEITNLEIDLESMCIIGGPSSPYAVDVFLILTEQNPDGTWALSAEESSVAISGVDATFIDGYAYDIDVDAPAVKVVLHVEFGGTKYELQIDMTSKPVNIEITDATIITEEYPDGMGGTYTNWTMEGQWSDGNTSYPVLVDMSAFDPTVAEADITISIQIGSWMDVFYGAAEGLVHATVAENVVTLTGTLTSYTAGTWEVSISGTLPADEPEVPTALDNVDTTVAPAKAIVNGQLVITKDGVQYNAQGAILK